MRIGFYTNQLGLRGSDQFCYDLAHYNETLLGHTSFIITPKEAVASSEDVTHGTAARFKSRFRVMTINLSDLEQTACSLQLDCLYISKWGVDDGVITYAVPCIIHAIFECIQPHGHVYVAISDYMKNKCRADCKVLPFMAQLMSASDVPDLRTTLGIPPNALVFARHGGWKQFDVKYMCEAVKVSATKYPQVFFLFLNTQPFMEERNNVRFLSGSAYPQDRASFVHAADVMLHGRSDGETYGLACGEFSVANKPIITTNCGDTAHIDILEARCFTCTELKSALDAVENCIRIGRSALAAERWDMYSKYTPASVTTTFQQLIHLAIREKNARMGL